jgi:PPOX class probable F420-dependent enzyme
MPARMSKSQRDAILTGRHVAVLVTIAPDGSPVPTPIWYLYRDGLFWSRTAGDAVKATNIRRDPRVSICIQDERPPYRSVVVHGRAEVRDPPTGSRATCLGITSVPSVLSATVRPRASR